MMDELELDPYAILNIPHDADDATIKESFHANIQKDPNNLQMHAAYNKIRNQENRILFKWQNPYSYIEPPPILTEKEIPFADLAKELAFLSDWELGENDNDYTS